MSTVKFTRSEVMEYIEQEDVRFVRLVFCDAFGRQKNIAIMPDELSRAFESGISFDASAIAGFSDETKSDLLLFPIPSTLTSLPWRSYQGNVASMYCDIRYPDGSAYEKDSRAILCGAVEAARKKGVSVCFGSEYEFYLFRSDDRGNPTDIPLDNASYMDITPDDRGEDIRREICLALIDMGIRPESAHHEMGPGQNEIDFRYSEPVTAADNALSFISVVKSTAIANGLHADFSPKPLKDQAGNGMHINISVKTADGSDKTAFFMAGILAHVKEISAFLNPTEDSYKRLGEKKAPKYITWSPENRSQLIRIPAAKGEYRRIELRSPDPMTNPYIAYALLIYAGLDGIERALPLQPSTDINLYTAGSSVTEKLDKLPDSLEEAVRLALESSFVASVLPEGFTDYLKG